MLGEHLGTISGPTSMKSIAAVGGHARRLKRPASRSCRYSGRIGSHELLPPTARPCEPMARFYGECPQMLVSLWPLTGSRRFRADWCWKSNTGRADSSSKGVVYFETQAPSLAIAERQRPWFTTGLLILKDRLLGESLGVGLKAGRRPAWPAPQKRNLERCQVSDGLWATPSPKKAVPSPRPSPPSVSTDVQLPGPDLRAEFQRRACQKT